MIKKMICAVLATCFLAVAFGCGYRVWTIYSEYRSAENSYTGMEQYVSLPDTTPTAPQQEELQAASYPSAGEAIETDAAEPESTVVFPEIDFISLQGINSGIVGWIYCEDTMINYPIAQAADNTYYLKHLFNGESNSTGCIFLDYRNSSDFSDRHSVIYGHHLSSGNMFAALMNYKSQEFYEEHPSLLLMTQGGNFVVTVFAGYVAEVTDGAWDVSFESDEAFEAWITESIAKSCIQTGIVPETTDHILTLSTCSYEFSNARFVLLGILD